MARLTMGQKADRCLKLLIGMEQPAVIDALKPRGFTKQDLDDGWDLLRGLSRSRLGPTLASPVALSAVQQVDAFENQYYPVARVTLERRHPAIAEYLFANLPQTGGMHVVVSVQLFLERLTELASGQSPFGEEGVAARTLLAQRGLTPQICAETQAILDRVRSYNDQYTPPAPPAKVRAAEDALWSWYREWGGIVRQTITDRRLLRSLGFLKSTKSSGEEEVDDFEAVVAETPAPPVVDSKDKQVA